ncbi:MAG: DUF2997 domain-containing protein [Pirellulaceae bacterium]
MKIEIIVSPAGEVRVETKGFTGAVCRSAGRALEQSLGSLTHEQLTREYFEFMAVEQPQQQRQ